jgi:quinol monooxygenase YgiN
MKFQMPVFMLLMTALPVLSVCQEPGWSQTDSASGHMMIRMAEIEIHPEFIDQYLAVLKEESEASVRLEPGVICIYPMFQKEHPAQIRLLEIYADKAAYESHLQTPHFKHYKETTLKMVKDLKLIDMEAIDMDAMPEIFSKLKTSNVKN